MRTSNQHRQRAVWCAAALALLLGACRQDMHDQPRFEPLEKNSFFDDMRSARPRLPGTVARGQLQTDRLLYAGRAGGALATAFPFPLTRADIERGRERFNIFCQPCHGPLGEGDGIVVRRGFRHPPSYHSNRLREAPAGHFFDVITNGFGAMADFSDRLAPEDRWRVVAYIRALQLSQNASVAELPAELQQEFEAAIEASGK